MGEQAQWIIHGMTRALAVAPGDLLLFNVDARISAEDVQELVDFCLGYFPHSPVLFLGPSVTMDKLGADELRSMGLARIQ